MEEDNLNNLDVINLAQNPSIDNKSLIAEKITKLYNNPRITPVLIKLVEDIFRIMVRDTEIKVREALANCLKNCTDLPKDIVKNISMSSLLNDIIISVTEKDGQVIVTSISDQEELDSYADEGWILGEEEHVLDGKTH